MMQIFITAIVIAVAYLAYRKFKKAWVAAASAVLAWYVVTTAFRTAGEGFSVGDAMYPFATAPVGLVGGGNEAEGDLNLTDMYRRLHNLDAIQRAEIFQFNDALAGGSYNIPVEPYIGAAYDREMMNLKQRIREDIAARRRSYSELYDTPTKPAFVTVGPGDDRILGIPSQVGSLPYYY